MHDFTCIRREDLTDYEDLKDLNISGIMGYSITSMQDWYHVM